jgi:hypothetical protein
LGPEAEVGASGSRSIPRKWGGEESPNTIRQGASRIRLWRKKRGSCRQYLAGTDSITENTHLDFFERRHRETGEKVV